MPFQAGQSGNPKGRPKRGNTMTDALKRALREKDADGRTNKDKVARALLQAALEGSIPAIREINERLDGKVEQQQEVTGKDGAPMQVSWAQLAEEADGND